MIPFLFILLIISICLVVSSLFLYILIQSGRNSKKNENQRIKYTIQPSMNIITKQLPSHLNISNPYRRSINEENFNQCRSHSLANNLFVKHCTTRRQSAIIDSKQIAQIEFSLPPTADKFRRRSVAICNNIIDSQTAIDSLIKTMKSSNQFLPCLISFSITYLKSSQIQIHFHSLTSLPANIHLQQLIIKVKLIPDGKTKTLEIKQIRDNENLLAESLIQFSNISLAKLHEKGIIMKFSGKDQTKKTIQLGQIGKIYFQQIKNFHQENPLDFIHEIELIKLSSIEILLLLEQTNEHYLTVDIQRIKGLKIDQKNTTGTCFFQVILLDRHRPLSTQQTKISRLNSSTFSLHDPLQFNILAFNSTNLDRIMLMISFYSNANPSHEHRCLARMKLASSFFCSGTGTIHWQQFKERQTFTMWHTLIKN